MEKNKLQQVIADEQQKDQERVKVGRIVLDDFFDFRSKLGTLIKYMAFEPEKRLVIAVQRNFKASPSRQLEYIIEVTTQDKIHVFNSKSASADLAIPATPNYPQVEKEEDSTVE